jgi:hypothetical protein
MDLAGCQAPVDQLMEAVEVVDVEEAAETVVVAEVEEMV